MRPFRDGLGQFPKGLRPLRRGTAESGQRRGPAEQGLARVFVPAVEFRRQRLPQGGLRVLVGAGLHHRPALFAQGGQHRGLEQRAFTGAGIAAEIQRQVGRLFQPRQDPQMGAVGAIEGLAVLLAVLVGADAEITGTRNGRRPRQAVRFPASPGRRRFQGQVDEDNGREHGHRSPFEPGRQIRQKFGEGFDAVDSLAERPKHQHAPGNEGCPPVRPRVQNQALR